MPRFSKFGLVAAALIALASCSEDTSAEYYSVENQEQLLRTRLAEQFGTLESLTLPNSDDYANIPSDPQNTLSKEKARLGKFLFYETGMGQRPKLEMGEGTYSCSSCHNPMAGFHSGRIQGIADGGIGFGRKGESRRANPLYDLDSIDVQPIRTPTILNAAYLEAVLWNGQLGGTDFNSGTEAKWTPDSPSRVNHLGMKGVETQAIAGITVAHRLKCDTVLVEGTPYQEMFDRAFPEVDANNRYNDTIAGLAIASFVRTVLANEAPFQRFLKGENGAMSYKEIKGAEIFFGKGKCHQCHSGPGLNGATFHALGMHDFNPSEIIGNVPEEVTKGRGGFTDNPDDEYKFKTPTLYNLKDVDFLGHGSSFSTVREVIEYKNEAIAENIRVPADKLAPEFTPLNLTESEIENLTAFVEDALRDPNLIRYFPEETPLGNCFPNADLQSRRDMGCD